MKPDNNITNKIQSIEYEMLIEFDRICRKYELTYYLEYGSLLGAIRHQDFIPWDDDLDISMPREDYNQFCNVAIQELPRYYFLQSEWNDKGHIVPLTRIRDERTDVCSVFQSNTKPEHRGIWIDIFPLDYCKGKNEMTLKFRNSIIQLLSIVMYYKRNAFRDCNTFKRKIRKIIFSPLYFFDFRYLRLRALTWKPSNPQYYVSFAGPYALKKSVFLIKDYGEPVEMKFKDKMFLCPSNYKAILTTLYGDYMTPPDANERKGHDIVIRNL